MFRIGSHRSLQILMWFYQSKLVDSKAAAYEFLFLRLSWYCFDGWGFQTSCHQCKIRKGIGNYGSSVRTAPLSFFQFLQYRYHKHLVLVRFTDRKYVQLYIWVPLFFLIRCRDTPRAIIPHDRDGCHWVTNIRLGYLELFDRRLRFIQVDFIRYYTRLHLSA